MLIKLSARRDISAAFRPRTRRVGSSPIDATVVATIAMLLPAALRPARLIRDVRMRQPQPLSHSVLAAALSCALLTGDPAASLGRVVDLDTPVGALQQQEKTIGDLFERATPSVVQITQLSARTNPYTMNEVEVPTGTGSGFIWDTQGHVVTNFHVIRGADAAKVTVTGPSGKTQSYDAELVGYNLS